MCLVNDTSLMDLSFCTKTHWVIWIPELPKNHWAGNTGIIQGDVLQPIHCCFKRINNLKPKSSLMFLFLKLYSKFCNIGIWIKLRPIKDINFSVVTYSENDKLSAQIVRVSVLNPLSFQLCGVKPVWMGTGSISIRFCLLLFSGNDFH